MEVERCWKYNLSQGFASYYKIKYDYQQCMNITQKDNISEKYLPRLPGEKLRIVFVFQMSCLWSNWKTLWESCIKDDQIDVKLILVERKFSDTTLHFLNESKKFLMENDIPYVTHNSFSLTIFHPHVVFFQTPYHGTLPAGYELSLLKELGCRIAYIPYGLEIGGGFSNINNQFNLGIQEQAWRIFARSNRHLRMFAKYCSVGSSHVVVSGHPRMDLYRNFDHIKINPQLLSNINGRTTILWNPHFSVNNEGWSTFLTYYEYIIEYFCSHPELFLIIRPHPLLFSRLINEAKWTREDLEKFVNKIEAMPNACFDFLADYLPAFKVSDTILTDASSFLLEYFVTGKPVCYLPNACGPGTNDDGDVIKYLYVANNEQEITNFLTMISIGDDPKKNQRIEAIPEYLITSNASIGCTIKEYLLNNINQYDRPVIRKNINEMEVRAQVYWENASNTYLASPEYYDKQEKALPTVLESIGVVNHALDIGCGDGRFTKIISKFAKSTKAIDISVALIEKAKITLASDPVTVCIDSITEPRDIYNSYDLISCMGVTSGLIDNYTFIRTIELMIACCKPGGYLLLKDSLALKNEQVTVPTPEGYSAVYRNVDDYLNCFLSRGCRIVNQHELVRFEERELVNTLYLFTKESSSE